MVEHIVLIKFNKMVDEDSKTNMRRELLALKGKIPGVLGVNVGPNFTNRSKGYDEALVVRMESKEVLASYTDHPAHKLVVQEYIKPIMEDILAVDFEVR